MKEYEVLPHSGDLMIRAYGRDLEHLYKNALSGMFESVAPEVISGSKAKRRVELKDDKRDITLIDFLNEALYQSDINNEAYFDVDFTELNPHHILAELSGNRVTGFRDEIKAVTYHGFEIFETDNGLEAPIIFDI